MEDLDKLFARPASQEQWRFYNLGVCDDCGEEILKYGWLKGGERLCGVCFWKGDDTPPHAEV